MAPAPLSISPPSTLHHIASESSTPPPPPSMFESVTDDGLKSDGLDMLNATLQLHWADRLGNSLRFKEISVFLIYWAKNIDELKCADEVGIQLLYPSVSAFFYSQCKADILRSLNWENSFGPNLVTIHISLRYKAARKPICKYKWISRS
jgi:hypothetical protein